MDGASSVLTASVIENNRWAVSSRQSPHFLAFHCKSSRPTSLEDNSSLIVFRSGLLEAVEHLKEEFELYDANLNAEFLRAEIDLIRCSTFAENCSRFDAWLGGLETEWKIPPKGSTSDAGKLDDKEYLWERQAVVNTYKVCTCRYNLII